MRFDNASCLRIILIQVTTIFVTAVMQRLMSACAVRSMVSLAASYHELKRHSDAVALREKIFEIQQRVLPEGHPDMGE